MRVIGLDLPVSDNQWTTFGCISLALASGHVWTGREISWTHYLPQTAPFVNTGAVTCEDTDEGAIVTDEPASMIRTVASDWRTL